MNSCIFHDFKHFVVVVIASDSSSSEGILISLNMLKIYIFLTFSHQSLHSAKAGVYLMLVP